jgi:transcriptional regulator GlxA family with amidase domain
MHRRHFLGSSLAASFAFFSAAHRARAAAGGDSSSGDRITRDAPVKVAFMLGEGANVIDTAGPWEVFQDTMTMDGGRHQDGFELYTVGPSKDVLRMTGGLQVKPNYAIDDAPQPNVIVVPAQKATDATRAWLRTASAGTDVTMSVCTGAFQLARAGLFKGLPATTHRDYFDSFQKEFPDVELRRGLRFVDNGRIASAGGLTSGIDLALHVVTRYFGVEAATATAAYMDYTSDAWRG